MKKVVLAYSGGLDTSCIVRWLKDQGYEVICFMADLGQGLGHGEDLDAIEARALAAGASKIYVKDLQDELMLFTIVKVAKGGAEAFTNLRAPVVVNSTTKEARQIILESDEYSVKTMLFSRDLSAKAEAS